jgi:hypothetical protein
VAAQPQATLKAAKVGTVPNLVQVAVPPAYAMALSETHGLLAFAHDRTYPDQHVSLVKLDAKGQPAAYCTSWKLPVWDALVKAKVDTYPVSVAFHPKLPLLYVWQDMALNNAVALTGQPPGWNLFDHLLIYNVAKETPELVVSLCRGEELHFGLTGGGLGVDPAGEFLYVPNVADAKGRFLHFGRFRLDADGLPIADDADVKLPLAARVKKLVERNTAKGLAPVQRTPVEYVHVLPLGPAGGGYSFHVVSKEAIISAGHNGVITWRPDDKVATMQMLPVKGQGHQRLTLHPTLPLIYLTTENTDSFYRIAHSEGWLSLLPLQITLADTRLFSAPVAFDKGSRVAVGGHYHVYIVTLDGEGGPLDAIKVPVLSPNVRALAYSPRFDRLYVGVEVSK